MISDYRQEFELGNLDFLLRTAGSSLLSEFPVQWILRSEILFGQYCSVLAPGFNYYCPFASTAP